MGPPQPKTKILTKDLHQEIGSYAVVRENIEPWTVNVGTPTRVVGQRRSDVILAHAAALGFPR